MPNINSTAAQTPDRLSIGSTARAMGWNEMGTDPDSATRTSLASAYSWFCLLRVSQIHPPAEKTRPYKYECPRRGLHCL